MNRRFSYFLYALSSSNHVLILSSSGQMALALEMSTLKPSL